MHGPTDPDTALPSGVDVDGPAVERDPVLDWLAHKAGITIEPWQAGFLRAEVLTASVKASRPAPLPRWLRRPRWPLVTAVEG